MASSVLSRRLQKLSKDTLRGKVIGGQSEAQVIDCFGVVFGDSDESVDYGIFLRQMHICLKMSAHFRVSYGSTPAFSGRKIPLQTRTQAMKSFKTIEQIQAHKVWNRCPEDGYNNQDVSLLYCTASTMPMAYCGKFT